MTKKETDQDKYSKLDDKDKAILRLILEHPTITNTRISKVLKISRGVVIQRRKKKDFQKAKNELQKEPLQILIDAQSKAARTLLKIMELGEFKDAKTAAKYILYGTGILKNNQIIEGNFPNINITVTHEDKE